MTAAQTVLRCDDVLARTGLSKTTLYKLIRQETFPKPVPLTAKAVGWPELEVAAWIDQRIAERDTAKKRKAA